MITLKGIEIPYRKAVLVESLDPLPGHQCSALNSDYTATLGKNHARIYEGGEFRTQLVCNGAFPVESCIEKDVVDAGFAAHIQEPRAAMKLYKVYIWGAELVAELKCS